MLLYLWSIGCGQQLQHAALTPFGRSSKGLPVLKLTLQCRNGDKARLVVITDPQGEALEAFGVRVRAASLPKATAMSAQIGPATLLAGHKTVVRMPGNFVLAQVQWHAATRIAQGLPRVARFGERAQRSRQLRAAWLFTAAGRPHRALFGTERHVADRVGVDTAIDVSASWVHVVQQLRNGQQLKWRVDKRGQVVQNVGP